MEGPEPGAVTLDPQNSKGMQGIQRFSTRRRPKILFNIGIPQTLQIAWENTEQNIWLVELNVEQNRIFVQQC